MQQTSYKYKLFNISLKHGGDFLEYKDTTLNTNQIIKFGISLPLEKKNNKYGLNKNYKEEALKKLKPKRFLSIKDENFQLLAEKQYRKYPKLIINYSKDNQKTSQLKIPLNLGEQNCINFLNSFIKNNKLKYIGVGQSWVIARELGIRIEFKKFFIIIFVFIVLSMTTTVFASSLPDDINLIIMLSLFTIYAIYKKI